MTKSPQAESSNRPKVSFIIRVLEDPTKENSVTVLSFEFEDELKAVGQSELPPSLIEKFIIKNTPDFEIEMTRKTWDACKADPSILSKQILAKKIDISGDFRKFSLVSHTLPRWLNECNC